jgi:hypothetical protein
MLWLTWRQFRVQAVAFGVVAVLVIAVLVVNQISLAGLRTTVGLDSCSGDACVPLVNSLLKLSRNGSTWLVYNLIVAVMYLVPPLTGMFWGAPLVARELESGTFKLVWVQSVDRTRWLTVKVAVIGIVAMALTGVLSAVAGWSGRYLSSAAQDRLTALHFGAGGIVPIAYSGLAFALGVTAGIVARRTLPAMAVALVAYVGVVVGLATVVRQHLIPPVRALLPFDVTQLDGLIRSADLQRLTVIGSPNLPGAWILSNETVTAAGEPFTGPASPQFCGDTASPQDCLNWLGSLGLQEKVSYQPMERYWPLQWTEAGMVLALAGAVLAFGFWWLRTRTR